MAQPHFSTANDDDLPRTFRREKEAREREAAEQEARTRAASAPADTDPRGGGPRLGSVQGDSASGYEPPPSFMTPRHSPQQANFGHDLHAGVVHRLQIPFFHLMFFFLKAVVAAIPALILLTFMLYGLGQALKIFMPWLVQAEILIRLPR